MSRTILLTIKFSIFTSIVILPTLGYSSGFLNWEQSAMGAGFAHADMAAGALDASTAYYNPAGMTHIEDSQISIGGEWMFQHIELSGVHSVIGDDNIPTSNIDSSFQNVAPNFHIVYPIENIPFEPRIGISGVMVANYGTYYNNPATNGYAKKTTQKSYLVSPSIAFEIIDDLSFGAGMDIQDLRSTYSSNFNGTLGGAPIMFDTDIDTLEDWALGWNVGLLYDFTEATRVGATFRSKTTYHQTGPLEFEDFTDGLTAYYDADSEMILPPISTIGIYHDVNKRWSLMSSIAFVKWDELEDINISSEFFFIADPTSGSVEMTIPAEFRNTWFASVGSAYRFTEDITGRAGFSYDESAVTSANREMRLPEANRYTFAAGLGYMLLDTIQIDVSYQFVYSPSGAFSNPNYFAFGDSTANPGIIYGDSKQYNNIVGLQLSSSFGQGES